MYDEVMITYEKQLHNHMKWLRMRSNYLNHLKSLLMSSNYLIMWNDYV